MQVLASSVGLPGGNWVGIPSSILLGITESLCDGGLLTSGLVLSWHAVSGRGESIWLQPWALEGYTYRASCLAPSSPSTQLLELAGAVDLDPGCKGSEALVTTGSLNPSKWMN
jgi:hypothetical protein